MNPDSNAVARITVLAAVLGAVAAGVVWFFTGLPGALSCAVGTAIAMANLWAIGRLVPAMLDENRPKFRRSRAALLLAAKAIALVSLIGLLVVRRWIRGGPMMVGFSVVALAIVLATVFNGGSDSSTRSLR